MSDAKSTLRRPNHFRLFSTRRTRIIWHIKMLKSSLLVSHALTSTRSLSHIRLQLLTQWRLSSKVAAGGTMGDAGAYAVNLFASKVFNSRTGGFL